FLTIRCADVAKDDTGSRLLQVLAKDLALDRFGLTPSDVERATLLKPTDDGPPRLFVRTVKPYDRAAVLKVFAEKAGAKVEEKAERGRPFYVAGDRRQSAVYFADAHVFFSGQSGAVSGLVYSIEFAGKTRGPLDGALAR